jgi:septal ring factor EnvC (AmiA/AmiB activator)
MRRLLLCAVAVAALTSCSKGPDDDNAPATQADLAEASATGDDAAENAKALSDRVDRLDRQVSDLETTNAQLTQRVSTLEQRPNP